MAVTAGDVFQVTFRGLWCNQITLSTFRYQATSIIGAPPILTFVTDMFNQLNLPGGLIANFLACCPPQYQLVEVWIQQIAPIRLVKTVFPVGTPGTRLFPGNIPNIAGVITRRGAVANKHNVGGLHVPASNLDVGTSNGQLSPGYIGLLQTVALQLVANITDVAGNVSSPCLFPNKTLDISKTVPITAAFVQQTSRTMRQRTVGHGK